jgi:hypothetical protein
VNGGAVGFVVVALVGGAVVAGVDGAVGGAVVEQAAVPVRTKAVASAAPNLPIPPT